MTNKLLKNELVDINDEKIDNNLLVMNLGEKDTSEFLDYYIKLNNDIDKKKALLEKEIKAFEIQKEKDLRSISVQKEKLLKDYNRRKKELSDYEKYLDNYKSSLVKEQQRFADYQKFELSKLIKQKDELMKLEKEKEKDKIKINNNCTSLSDLASKLEKSAKRIDN